MLLALVVLVGCTGGDAAEVERCNERDDDGDGRIDEAAVDVGVWYLDVDGDGFGVEETAWVGCDAPDAHVDRDGDCDDSDPAVAPDQLESCDGVDQDCDGVTDEDALDALVSYRDRDRDGFGNPDEWSRTCGVELGRVADDRDCDDDDATVHPGAAESCDDRDEDCDEVVDEEADDVVQVWPDADGDGYGTDTGWLEQCDVPSGYAEQPGDCDDSDTGLSPDREEVCGDGLDNDCDGTPSGCAPWGTMSLADARAQWFGDDSGEAAGSAVAAAGDVDGDGWADLWIGAPEDDDGGSGSGSVYLLLGPHTGATMLRNADAVLRGATSSGALGSSLAGLGDLDGDGAAEAILGAPLDTTSTTQGGAAWLLSGPVTSGSVSAASSAVIIPEVAGPQVGTAVAGGVDLDGDGLGELLVSARWADGEGTDRGAVAVWQSAPTGETWFTDADLLWHGESDGDGAGSAVGVCEDLDGDGYGELVVGAPYADPAGAQSGAGYRLVGVATGTLRIAATYLGSDTNEYLGADIACGGSQVAVAAPGFEGSGTSPIGAAFWFAGTHTGSLSLTDAQGIRTGTAASESASAVAAAGDVDADGRGDWLVTAPGDGRGGPGAGAVWLSYGPVSGRAALSTADAGLLGADDWDRAGDAAAGVGDVDGDGYDDFLIGATAGAAHEAGSVHLVVGNGW